MLNKKRQYSQVGNDDATKETWYEQQKLKKRNRRVKKIKRNFQNLKLVYNNVRGIRSKIDSVATVLEELSPTIFCAVETHLEEEYKLEIEGYAIHSIPGTRDSQGIVIAIKEEIDTIAVELDDYTDVGQIKWIQMDNTKVKMKLGVVYAPQESVTLKKELRKMYDNIELIAISRAKVDFKFRKKW